MKHLLFFFLIPIFSFAQISDSKDITYKVGSPYPVILKSLSEQYFYHDGVILTFKVIKNNEYIIQKMDANSLKFKSVRNYSDLPFYHVFEGIRQVKDKLYFFYSDYDKEQTKEQLFYKEIDFETGLMSSESKLLIRTTGKVTGFQKSLLFSVKKVDKFDILISSDSSKVLVKHRLVPENKIDDISYDIIGFHVFDSNLSPIWEEEIKMPYTEKKMDNIDYAIDSYGNSFILTTVYKDDSRKRFKKDGTINYHMELLRIDAETHTLSNTKIELNDQRINRIQLYESEKGKMVCAGFFSNFKNSNHVEGIFVATVDKANNLTHVKSHKIPIEVLNLYKRKRVQDKNTKREEKGKRTEFANLNLVNFITRSDGSIILIGEQYYWKTHETYSEKGRGSTYYTHHFEDILISKLNPDGSLAWMKVLPKRQEGRSAQLEYIHGRSVQGGLGFKHYTQNNDHYLLFMDDIENLELSEDKKPKTHYDRGGYLTCVKVSDDGAISKFPILNIEEVPELKKGAVFRFGVNRIVNVSDNEFVVEFFKKKKEDVLIKFKIN